MSSYELRSFSSPEELARAVAAEWLGQLRSSANRAPYGLALSGGRIARLLFSAISEQARREQAPLGNVHFFWADERCVPPQHPESNFAVARSLLLEPLAVGEERIHRIRGEEPPTAAAWQASADLRATLPANPEGTPILDLIFLGMGEDGHVASLFPGEPPPVKRDPAIYRSVVAVKPPPERITLGYGTIAAARHVWVLASGSGKAQALEDSLKPSGQTPLAEVLRSRRHSRIFSDIRLGKPPEKISP